MIDLFRSSRGGAHAAHVLDAEMAAVTPDNPAIDFLLPRQEVQSDVAWNVNDHLVRGFGIVELQARTGVGIVVHGAGQANRPAAGIQQRRSPEIGLARAAAAIDQATVGADLAQGRAMCHGSQEIFSLHGESASPSRSVESLSLKACVNLMCQAAAGPLRQRCLGGRPVLPSRDPG
jgi:hypothetical protein